MIQYQSRPTPTGYEVADVVIGARYRLEREGPRCALLSRTTAGWRTEGTFDYEPDLWALMAEFVENDERLVMDLGPCDVAALAFLGAAMRVEEVEHV